MPKEKSKPVDIPAIQSGEQIQGIVGRFIPYNEQQQNVRGSIL